MSEAWTTQRRTLCRVLLMMALVLAVCFWVVHQLRKESPAKEAKADEASLFPLPMQVTTMRVELPPETLQVIRLPDQKLPLPDEMLSSPADAPPFDPAASGVGRSLIDLRYETPPVDLK